MLRYSLVTAAVLLSSPAFASSFHASASKRAYVNVEKSEQQIQFEAAVYNHSEFAKSLNDAGINVGLADRVILTVPASGCLTSGAYVVTCDSEKIPLEQFPNVTLELSETSAPATPTFTHKGVVDPNKFIFKVQTSHVVKTSIDFWDLTPDHVPLLSNDESLNFELQAWIIIGDKMTWAMENIGGLTHLNNVP